MSDIIAKNKCGGRDVCVYVCAKVLKEAREKRKKEKELKISENELTSVGC